MSLTSVFGFMILILAIGAQIIKRSFLVRFLKYILLFSVLGILGILVYWSVIQYSLWANDNFGKFFLPPHQSINYYLGYVGGRLFTGWGLALGAAFLLAVAAKYLNKRMGGRFFEEEEPMLLALGVFLSGYPGFLFYIIFLLLAGVLLSILYAILKKGRAPLYYLWLPTAIFAIIIVNWFAPQTLLVQFNL